MGQGGPMSAVNSNSDDRDLEAIRRAQRAHEPSMEEILASIRNIIAEEHSISAPDAVPPDEEPLLSSEANEAVTASFGVLSANLAARSAELADGLAREMLRPMLKQWLDENLPALVERLVRAEIQRVARGRK